MSDKNLANSEDAQELATYDALNVEQKNFLRTVRDTLCNALGKEFKAIGADPYSLGSGYFNVSFESGRHKLGLQFNAAGNALQVNDIVLAEMSDYPALRKMKIEQAAKIVIERGLHHK